MKQLLSFLLGFFFVAVLAAQPTIEWQKCIGGSKDEYRRMIINAQDGGYIILSATHSNDGDVSGGHGDRDIWLIKLDESANILWQRCYGGSKTDDAGSIAKTSDGGYVMVGSTWSNDGDVSGNNGGDGPDWWVVKITVNGDIQWQKVFGGTEGDSGGSIFQTEDGGYILSGSTDSFDGDVSNHMPGVGSDVWIVKLDGAGNLQWDICRGGTKHDFGVISKSSLGGYLLSALTNSTDGDIWNNHGGWDIWLAKLTDLGAIEWKRTLGGNDWDSPGGLSETSDGGYIITGYTRSNNADVSGNHGNEDGWVVKLSATRQIQWQKALGGSGFDASSGIHQSSDGGYIVFSYTESTDGDVSNQIGSGDPWLVKLSSNGDILWEKTYGGSNYDPGGAFIQTSDDGFLMMAGTDSNDGDVSGHHGGRDIWLVKLSPEFVGTTAPASQAVALETFPNPAQQSITVKIGPDEIKLAIHMTDLLGREVISQNIQNGGEVDISGLLNGFYLLRATTQDGMRYVQKFKKED